MKRSVVILGGGVAGMSAAHELIERGFHVTVYEKDREIPGGKARSIPIPNTGKNGRKDLPGEHGFRFFPGFYRHLPDTMRHIPYGQNKTVFDNLVEAREVEITFGRDRHVILPLRLPRSLEDLRRLVKDSAHLPPNIGLTENDVLLYTEAIWCLLTSCEERRAEEYEKKMSWWKFIRAKEGSDAYRKYLAGTTRVLVAADPLKSNAKTVGDIMVQMIFDVVEPGVGVDRVLNGPTNEVWIKPWLEYLRRRGVDYHFNATVKSINCKNGKIINVTINELGKRDRKIEADYYVAALPVEEMAKYVTPQMLEADPTLEGIGKLAPDVGWMNGIQFYLTEDVPLTCGHQMHLDAPWALTSLSQAQFWCGNIDLPRDYGDGSVRGIISVDISDWDTPGTYVGNRKKKNAKECTPAQIKTEVWLQLKKSLEGLPDEPYCWFLDPAVHPDPKNPKNDEPLLVNKVNTWRWRPGARTRIPNLFLASDYVRTYTDLATMEAANEAARRAVNAIIDEAGSGAPDCGVWNLHEPFVLKPWRWLDRWRYRNGMPWLADVHPLVNAVQTVVLTVASPPTPSPRNAERREPMKTKSADVPEEIQAKLGDFIFNDVRPAIEKKDVGKLKALFEPTARLCIAGRFLTLDEFLTRAKEFLGPVDRVEMDVVSAETIEVRPQEVFATFMVDFAWTPTRLRQERSVSGLLHLTLVPKRDRGRRRLVTLADARRRVTDKVAAGVPWVIRGASYEPENRPGRRFLKAIEEFLVGWDPGKK